MTPTPQPRTRDVFVSYQGDLYRFILLGKDIHEIYLHEGNSSRRPSVVELDDIDAELMSLFEQKQKQLQQLIPRIPDIDTIEIT